MPGSACDERQARGAGERSPREDSERHRAHRLSDDQPPDGARRGAQGQAHADLAGALLDRTGRDPVDAHDGQRQPESGESEQQRAAEALGAERVGQERLQRDDVAEGLRRVDGEHRGVHGGGDRRRVAALGADHQRGGGVRIVVLAVGDVDGRFRRLAVADVAHVAHHADHLVPGVRAVHAPPERILAGPEAGGEQPADHGDRRRPAPRPVRRSPGPRAAGSAASGSSPG